LKERLGRRTKLGDILLGTSALFRRQSVGTSLVREITSFSAGDF